MVNPITIYTTIWFLCFLVYDCGIMSFLPLTWHTFFYIYGANLCVILGCILGKFLANFHLKCEVLYHKRSFYEKKNALKKVIIITSVLSGIDIIPDLVKSISMYGTNLIANTSDLYFNEISSSQESMLSLSAFIFVTATFFGMYIVDYGFDFSMTIPALMLCSFALSRGSRGTFVIIVFLIFAAMTVPCTYGKERYKYHNILKKNIKKLVVIGAVFIGVILAITGTRHGGENVYSGYVTLDGLTNTIFISILGYLGSGIGCLNQYLINPITSEVPSFFFRVFFVIFNKLGLTNIDTGFWLPTYTIPMPANVITYIGELYHDFGNGLFVIIVFMACIFSLSFCKAIKSGSTFQRNMYAVMFTVFGLSFFANFIHAAGVWYAFILGGCISYFIDHKVMKIMF